MAFLVSNNSFAQGGGVTGCIKFSPLLNLIFTKDNKTTHEKKILEYGAVNPKKITTFSGTEEFGEVIYEVKYDATSGLSIKDNQRQLSITNAKNSDDWYKTIYSGQKHHEIQTSLKFSNVFGKNAAEVNYVLRYYYGGKIDGRGALLGNISFSPKSISIANYSSFHFRVILIGVTNIGTVKNPVAQAMFQVETLIDGLFNSKLESRTVIINGYGEYQEF